MCRVLISPFLSTLKVVYGKSEGDAPPDRVREHSHKSDDINHGHEGKCVPSL